MPVESPLTATECRELMERMGQFSAQDKRALLLTLRKSILHRCESDGLFWLEFVKTRDEADPKAPVKPFPVHLQYIRDLWGVLAEHQRIVIAKSRQMILSWVLCAFCTHTARTRPHSHIVWQTQKKEDGCMMVSMAGADKDSGYQGRIQFIEAHLPPWLQVPIRASEGMIQYPNGSLIEALAGGANQIRSKVPSLIIQDEFAFQDEARGVYGAVAPLIQKATKFIAVSTPNGMDNIFAELYHGYRVTGEAA